MNPLVSIIIPIYKVEKYIKDCIKSVMNQDYPYVEIILVDDGSPDNSLDIAKKALNKKINYKLIQQSNSGLGAARNSGLQESSGELIYFLDSDDRIPKEAIKILVRKLTSTNSDICMGRSVWLNSGSNTPKPVEYLEKWFSSSLYNYRKDFRFAVGAPIATNKLYKRELLNNIFFPEGMTGEDVIHSIKTWHKSKIISTESTVTYLRTFRESQGNKSITQTFSNKHFNDRIRLIKLSRDYCQKNNLARVRDHVTKSTLLFLKRNIVNCDNKIIKKFLKLKYHYYKYIYK